MSELLTKYPDQWGIEWNTNEIMVAKNGIDLGKLQRPHCDLTGIMVSKGNHPQMAFFQVSELL